ncbi:MAG TPA: biosynthetic-type acetolactate synthase large subunit [Leucothrix mucor]|nr:biosynthetic-type acetolactate synthase large subunit [Leucothrix mucor]
MKLSGAEIFIECLKAEKVDTIFGYPGGAVLFLYDELYKAEERGDIRHILARHEQGAVHGAEGYAKSTDKPGVCIVTSGPGATNAVTGIADAYMDSVPLVVISGQVPRALIGNDSFQEIDIIGITRPCVKHNFLVTKIEDIAPTMRKAFHIATTGRPGPVVVDIPKDLTNGAIQKIEFDYPNEFKMRSYQPTVKGNKKQIKKALEMIEQAKKPILYAGGGVVSSKAEKELTEFGRAFNFPVTTTLMGLGTYPSTDKQHIGMLGMHGTFEANRTMHYADLIIAVGARFDDRVTGDLNKFSPHAKVIHIDIDPATISKNIKAHNPIVGDVKQVLQEMFGMMKEHKINPDKSAFDAWWKEIKEWQAVNCLAYDQGDDHIKAQYVVEKLWEVTNGEAYVASDVGQHQMWAAQYYKFDKPNRWINSGGLGTMGFGLPAAMGIQLAHPDETVACITGDGSIQMCIQELATCSQYNLPLNIINLNNGYLGMVRQWQEFFYEERYAMTYNKSLPDFVKLAEAYGHVGLRIDKPEDVEGALKEAIKDTKNLHFLDFVTEPQGNVYPMIPAGYGHNEMYLNKQDALDDMKGKK